MCLFQADPQYVWNKYIIEELIENKVRCSFLFREKYHARGFQIHFLLLIFCKQGGVLFPSLTCMLQLFLMYHAFLNCSLMGSSCLYCKGISFVFLYVRVHACQCLDKNKVTVTVSKPCYYDVSLDLKLSFQTGKLKLKRVPATITLISRRSTRRLGRFIWKAFC